MIYNIILESSINRWRQMPIPRMSIGVIFVIKRRTKANIFCNKKKNNPNLTVSLCKLEFVTWDPFNIQCEGPLRKET